MSDLDFGTLLSKIRATGADLTLERGKLIISSGVGLNADQRNFIARHRSGFEDYLRQRQAQPSVAQPVVQPAGEGDTVAYSWEQWASLLRQLRPQKIAQRDWLYWIDQMTASIERALEVRP